MTEEQKNKRKSLMATVLFYVVLFVVLYFFGFRQLIPDTEEGVLISFGDTELGSGTTQPVASIAKPTPAPSTPAPAVSAPKPTPVEEKAPEVIKTQDFDDEAPEVKAAEKEEPVKVKKPKPDPEVEKRKAEEAERLRKEKEAQLRKQKEAEEQRRREEAERARKKAIQDQLALLDQEHASSQNTSSTATGNNPFAGAGDDQTSQGQGNTEFPGNAGSPHGDPNANASTGNGLGKTGKSFSLSGRKLSGKLPEPVYNVQEEGTVVVEIVVDQNGKVIGAKAILKGSTTQNATLQKVAIEAAHQAHFNADAKAALKQIGTITYHFHLD